MSAIRTGTAFFAILLLPFLAASGCPRADDRFGDRNGDRFGDRLGRLPFERPSSSDAPREILFCSWNVENFFDDEDDPSNHDETENDYAAHPQMFREKADQIANAFLLMNDGIGPDIAALVEVESERCLEVLRDRLNEKLAKANRRGTKYETILFKGDHLGRRFAPGFIARVPALADRTRKVGNRYNGRILEGHFEIDRRELIVISGHWTSRVTDKENDGERRMSYAKDTYGRFRAILNDNPDADVIVCGDFNDQFLDKSLQDGLHTTRNFDAVRNSLKEPMLLALFDEQQGDPPGTIYGRGRWSTFDHICLSRGLLDDRGWSADLRSARIFAPQELRTGKKNEPFRFGDSKTTGPRGYSDHFPLTVRLKLDLPARPAKRQN